MAPFAPFRLLDRLLGPSAARRGFRAVDVYLERIGDTAQMLDIYVKGGELGFRPQFRGVLIASRRRVVNRPYLEYWRPYVRIVTRSPVMRVLERLCWSEHVAYKPGYQQADGSPWDPETAHAVIQVEWEKQGRPALLALSDADRERGRKWLARLGIPEDAWFVALHARSAGYLEETPESHRWWRNVDVETYLPAIRAVTERGGWVVRLGDPTMQPLPERPQVVDYAHSEVRDDWLDVYLSSACRFMIGTTSGMAIVAETFGVPLAATNWVPFSSVPRSAGDIYQPKLYRRRDSGELVPFAELLEPPLFDLHDGRELAKLGIEVVDNAPEEIEALVVEMLGRLDGTVSYSAADQERQRRFRSLFRHLPEGPPARAGRAFLQTYEALLPAG